MKRRDFIKAGLATIATAFFWQKALQPFIAKATELLSEITDFRAIWINDAGRELARRTDKDILVTAIKTGKMGFIDRFTIYEPKKV